MMQIDFLHNVLQRQLSLPMRYSNPHVLACCAPHRQTNLLVVARYAKSLMKTHIIYWISAIVFLGIFSSAYAEDKLKDVQQEIKVVQKDLQQQRTTQAELQKKLKLSEEYASQLQAQHQQTKAQLKAQISQLNTLQQTQTNYEIKLKQQQQEIANQIRAAYVSGHSEFLKILLSQKNITDIQKNLVYYRYLLGKRLELIEAFQQTMDELKKNTLDIERNTNILLELQKQQQLEITKIQDIRLQRHLALEKIGAVIVSKSDHLAVLEQNKQALDNVVVELKVKSQSSAPVQHDSLNESFAKNKGNMKWPTQGKIIEGFDSRIEGSEIKLNGVLISAPQGEKVYAIAPGQVVFSQWMSGYGLLVIVDHGNGYMTLYGRNDVVYRKVGDKVSAGDVLGTVGTSGGYDKPALYFAIRSDGKALNPSNWCIARPT